MYHYSSLAMSSLFYHLSCTVTPGICVITQIVLPIQAPDVSLWQFGHVIIVLSLELYSDSRDLCYHSNVIANPGT